MPHVLSTVGKRAFPVAGANLWNDLPLHITSAQSLTVLETASQDFSSSLVPVTAVSVDVSSERLNIFLILNVPDALVSLSDCRFM